MYQHFKSANELKWSLGPLLKDIGGLGFPFKESLIILGILLLVTGFLIYQSKKDNFEEDERNFKYSDSGVYGTAGLLTESELKGSVQNDQTMPLLQSGVHPHPTRILLILVHFQKMLPSTIH